MTFEFISDLEEITCRFNVFIFFVVNKDSLTDKENRVQDHKRQMSEACGENDYNTTKELIKNNIDSLQE